jgi:hypothetical protein
MHSPTDTTAEEDFNIVATWLDADKTRWVAGVMAGLFAGLVAMGLAMAMSVVGGLEFWFPVKLLGMVIYGPSATEYGMHAPILAGFLIWEGVAAFWGFIYGHFVKTDSLGALLAMGMVWGLFLWIFDWNLFLHADKSILASNVSPASAFPVCLTYGLALTSVAFFYRAMGGKLKQV